MKMLEMDAATWQRDETCYLSPSGGTFPHEWSGNLLVAFSRVL